MGNLEISILGQINIRLQGRPISKFRSQKEKALLAYLAHSGQTHSREFLADLLWDARSTKQSLSNLRTVLSRLNKRFGDQLILTRKTAAIQPQVHERVDSVRFQVALANAPAEPDTATTSLLTQGLDLYQGELLSGFSLENAPRFNDWLVVEQERLRQMAMRGFRQLTGLLEEQGTFTSAASTAQRWVTWDPFNETAQQQLMRLLAYDGRPTEALQRYEKFCNLLQSELAVYPAPATRALYEQIQSGELAAPRITVPPPHNLPRALTPLFGRKKEITRLTALLIDPDYPLVSLTGPGGMGKTSLALAAGRNLLEKDQHPFPDGIWFVPLEEVTKDQPPIVAETVAALVAQALGASFHQNSELWPQLVGQLASKKLLLILDNLEQFLTTASDLILELLGAGDGIHILATSRSTPALATSVNFPLQGLPPPGAVSAAALNNDCVRLFAERAARTAAPFSLKRDLPEVVAICNFVHGMPLGIELAAAALGQLMIDEILPALSQNMQLLASARRDLPARQRTLPAVFETSWQLLDVHEQHLLAQISIFRGGFTRQAAEAVLTSPTGSLYRLQHHALLNRDQNGRFRMHPLLRQLAREKLNEPALAETATQVMHRHSLYFSAFLQSFAADLRRGVGLEAVQTILPEQDNLRAAWKHAIRVEQWPAIADSLDGAHYFYQRKGLFSAEEALVDEAITAVQSAMNSDDLFLTALLSRLLAVRATDHLNVAQFDEGIEKTEQACEFARKLGSCDLEGQARLVWARIYSRQYKRAAALEQFEKVVTLAEDAQNQFLEADGWIGIGGQLIWQEDTQKTEQALHHALDLCRALQYKSGEVGTLRYLGTLETRRESFAAAVDYHQQALALSRQLGDFAGEAEELGSLGVALNQQGDLPGSQIYQQEALTIFRKLNMSESVAWLLGELGYTALRLGDYAGSEEKLTEALAISIQLQDTFWQGWLKLRLGRMWQERGEQEKGLGLIMEAYHTAEQFQYVNFKAAVLYDWGNLLLSQKDWEAAERKFQEAFDLRQGSGRIEQAMPSLAGLAYAIYRQDRTAEAAALAEQLWQVWQEKPQAAQRADLMLYWRLGQVWQGLGDDRTANLWASARALLQERAGRIPDDRARRMFLEEVPAHRALFEVLA